MYLGHFAVGFAAKPIASKVSLGILLVATQVIDILYGIFQFVGVGQPGTASPWDHGLVMSLVWSAIAFIIAFRYYQDIRSGIIIGVLVFSHWVLDFIAWDHALPIAFKDSPLVGLGLYNNVVMMLIGDFGLFAIGIAIYFWKTRANDRTGRWAPWVLIAYILALIPACLLPGKLIVITALGMILVVPLGYWVDRHRSVIPITGK
jgi:hypothetical protein